MYWFSPEFQLTQLQHLDIFTDGHVYMSECEYYIYPEQCCYPLQPSLAGPQPAPVQTCAEYLEPMLF